MNKEINGPMSPDIELESFLRTYIQAKRIFENPVCKQVFRNLQGTNNDLFERLEKECDQAEKEAEKVASSLLQQESSNHEHGAVRIYLDGGFDLPHSGHYNAIRQCRDMSDYLVVGVATDYEMGKVKGPTVLNELERAEILKHCKFTDRVITGCPYTPSIATIQAEGCNFYAHGDDPCIDSEGVDVCQVFRDNGMFKLFKRTEGVSTTDITARLLDLAEYTMEQEKEEPLSLSDKSTSEKIEQPPKQQFLATSRRIINFANSNMPGPNDRIVYIQGSFDLLHHGHLKRLQLAKEKGDFLYVGIWEDDMTRYYKGPKYPVISLQERVLMTLACRHVDDVVIGAPFIITKDLITSLNIQKVIFVKDSREDQVQSTYKDVDQFAIAREMGILEEIEVNEPFYDITTEDIAKRVHKNRSAYELKVKKKETSNRVYQENKEFVKEV